MRRIMANHHDTTCRKLRNDGPSWPQPIEAHVRRPFRSTTNQRHITCRMTHFIVTWGMHLWVLAVCRYMA